MLDEKLNETYTLIGSHLNDEACASLSSDLLKMKHITKIHLSETGISPTGCKELARMVRSHPSLTSLDLWQNQIGDEGAEAIATAIAGDKIVPFSSSNVIRFGHLYAASSPKTTTTSDTPAKQSNQPKPKSKSTEEVPHSPPPSSSSVSIVDAVLSPTYSLLTPSSSLSYSSSTSSSSSSSSSSILRHLELGGNNITPNGAKRLAECVAVHSTLLSLRLSDNHLGDDGAIYIAKALTSPNLSLTSLDLRNNDISNIGCQVLAVSIKTMCQPNVGLKHLDLRENIIGSEGGWGMVDAVGTNKSLLSLRMEANEGIRYIHFVDYTYIIIIHIIIIIIFFCIYKY